MWLLLLEFVCKTKKWSRHDFKGTTSWMFSLPSAKECPGDSDIVLKESRRPETVNFGGWPIATEAYIPLKSFEIPYISGNNCDESHGLTMFMLLWLLLSSSFFFYSFLF